MLLRTIDVIERQFPKEIAILAASFSIKTEDDLERWTRYCREWMTKLVEVEAAKDGLTDEERTKLADRLATAFNNLYLDLQRTIAGPLPATNQQ